MNLLGNFIIKLNRNKQLVVACSVSIFLLINFLSCEEDGKVLEDEFNAPVLSKNNFEENENKKEGGVECLNRDQLDIQNQHMQLVGELVSLSTEDLNESDLTKKISNVLEQMYQNFCEGEVLTFSGIVGTIENTENPTEVLIRIDDMVSSENDSFLFVYQSTFQKFKGLSWGLGEDFHIDDLIQYSFTVSDFLLPTNSIQAAELLISGETGSFPIDRMEEGANETFPDGEYYFFTIPIKIEDIVSYAELYTQYKDTDSTDINADARTTITDSISSKVQMYVEIAEAWIKEQNFSKASDYLNRAIDENPNSSNAYNVRGDLKYFQMNFDGALNDYNKAIQIDPENEEFYVDRGILKMELQYSVDEICIDLDKARELGSSAPILQFCN